MVESKIRYIACIGSTATYHRISVDLGCYRWPDRRIIVCRDNQDVHKLYGIAIENLAYVEMGMSPHQASFVRGRGINRISIEQAKELLSENKKNAV
jgi:hypothetical protein